MALPMFITIISHFSVINYMLTVNCVVSLLNRRQISLTIRRPKLQQFSAVSEVNHFNGYIRFFCSRTEIVSLLFRLVFKVVFLVSLVFYFSFNLFL